MSKIKSYLKLLRIRQWYKSVVIFIGVFFSGQLFSETTILNFSIIIPLVIGFILVGLTSSINYIINDLNDIEKDKVHPKKSKRPLASGAVSKIEAIFIIILIVIIIVLGIFLIILLIDNFRIGIYFSLMLVALIINGNLYNFYYKNKHYLDIISLSLMYIWRTWSGCIIADIYFSPWLFMLVYLFALFLAINKRLADLEMMGAENAHNHKEVYKIYTKESLEQLLQMVTISLFLIYSLYCILRPITPESGPQLSQNNILLMFSIPIALYVILRYLYISKTKPEIAIATEKAITDIPLVIGALILMLIVYIANYVDFSFLFFQ